MSSKSDILAKIRKNLPQAIELPDLEGDWIQYDDPIEQFRTVLEGVGGKLHIIQSVTEIPEILGELVSEDRLVASCVPGVLEDRFDFAPIDDPHQLEDIDFAILPGKLAVAENAAIWVDADNVPYRVTYFLSQHISLVVPKSQVVNNMHQAYEKISPSDRSFGCFISGPSKTADIEQSLVKGAHGARTLHVFFVDDLK